MTDGLWRVMPETRVDIDLGHLDATGEIRMTKSKAPPPETTDAPIVEDAAPVEPPHDAARSNLPAPEAPPPRDYTRAKATWQKACDLARGVVGSPASFGAMFISDTSAPDLWERQSQHLQDIWYEIAEAARA